MRIIFGDSVPLGGMLSAACSVASSVMPAQQLNAPGVGPPGVWPMAGLFEPGVLPAGLVLLLVGAAVEYGERLQRDTAGLVYWHRQNPLRQASTVGETSSRPSAAGRSSDSVTSSG